MKITEKQLLVLVDLAKWFSQLQMNWRDFGPIYSRETIEKLVIDIVNQQSDELIDIKNL
jgi:hypothetical protein